MVCEKKKKLSAVIHRRGLPFFRDDPKESTQASGLQFASKTSEKDLATAQREFSINAESHGMSLTDILPHIFFERSAVFSGDLPTHAENHTLVSEIEVAVPEKPIFNFHDNQPTSIVVDFMSIFRQLKLSDY